MQAPWIPLKRNCNGRCVKNRLKIPKRQVESLPTIHLDDTTVPYVVKQSPRRTRVSLVVVDGSVEVRMPESLPIDYAETYLVEKKDWILKHVRKHLARPPPSVTAFAEGDTLPLFGESLHLSVIKGAKTRFELEDRTLLLYRHPRATKRFLTKKLKDFYAQQLLRHLEQRIPHFASKGLEFPKKISVREYRRKWAACLSDNSLRFNWKLALAPPEVIDLVLVHELVHLRIRNHSKLFWATVTRYIPNRKELDEWLKSNASSLKIIIKD